MLKQVTGMAQHISELVFLYCRKQRRVITQIKVVLVSEYIFSHNFVREMLQKTPHAWKWNILKIPLFMTNYK